MLVALVATLLVWPLIAHAAARVVAPPGWLESGAAAPEAQRRAARWQAALGLQLEQVVSAPNDDRFAETVAVFTRSEPVPEQLLADESQATGELSKAVANLVDAREPEQAGLRRTGSGAQVVWGRWIVDDIAYECLLAPSGNNATVVIMAVRATDLDDERAVLDRIIDSLDGVSAPMPRFSLSAWRIGSVLVWLALALALHAAMLPFVDHEGDHATAGRRAALINVGLVLLGTGAAYVVLADRELALTHAGSTAQGLSVWIFVAGISVAGAHFLLASRFEQGVVQSAPSSGAFASGTFSTAEVLRSSISRSGMHRRELLESSEGSHAPSPARSGSSARIEVDPHELE